MLKIIFIGLGKYPLIYLNFLPPKLIYLLYLDLTETTAGTTRRVTTDVRDMNENAAEQHHGSGEPGKSESDQLFLLIRI